MKSFVLPVTAGCMLSLALCSGEPTATGKTFMDIFASMPDEVASTRLAVHLENELCTGDLNDNQKEQLISVLKKEGLGLEDIGKNNSTALSFRLCRFQKSIDTVNRLQSRNGTQATFALNLFSLLADHEFGKHFAGYLGSSPKVGITQHELAKTLESVGGTSSTRSGINSGSPSQKVDWVGLAVKEEVQDQGTCGGCWAFSASETIAAMNWIAQNDSQVPSQLLSAQQIISCAGEPNKGCLGGTYESVWSDYGYAKDNIVEPDSLYPFVDGKSGVTSGCIPLPRTAPGVEASTNVYVRSDTGGSPSNQDIMKVLMQHPVSISIVANLDCFQYYVSGTLKKSDCDTYGSVSMDGVCMVDHAVTLVGYEYQTENSNIRYKIKNSWGERWGQNGYVYFEDDSRESDESGCAGVLGMKTRIAFPAKVNQVGDLDTDGAGSVLSPSILLLGVLSLMVNARQ